MFNSTFRGCVLGSVKAGGSVSPGLQVPSPWCYACHRDGTGSAPLPSQDRDSPGTEPKQGWGWPGVRGGSGQRSLSPEGALAMTVGG